MQRSDSCKYLKWSVFSIGLLLLIGGLPLPGSAAEASRIGQTLDEGWVSGLIFVFSLGFLLNLTPCVYPMIPITVGYFGNRATTSWFRRFGDALLYLLGMALIYTLLGAMAGLTGQMLGQALQSPVIQGTLALVMVVMAASMFGMFELSVSESLESNLRVFADRLGTFGMGMTLGVAAAPCLAPSTVALLGYVGKQGSLLQGSLLFFVLSLGLGLPYVLLAVFTGLLDYLPSSGSWFTWVEKLLGHLLLGVAIYFLWPLLGPAYVGYLVIIWISAAVFDLSRSVIPESRILYGVRALLLILVGVVGIYGIVFNFLWLPPKLEWTKGEAFVEQTAVTRPTLVYTGADWCVPCQEMSVTTFQSEKVRRASRGIHLVKIDMTDAPPESVARWMSRHDLVGVPTMIFLKPGGEELRQLRGQGYLDADDFSERLRQLKDRSSSSYLSLEAE